MRLVMYLRAFRSTGALVSLLGSMALDMLPFLVILLCVVVAFSTCFYLLGEWDSMSESFFGAFMVMLGEFGIYDEKFEHTLPRIFLSVFLLVVLVVLMNLLIAIISDTFERVIERKAAQFSKEQATLICHLEQHKLFGWCIRRLFLTNEQVEREFLQVLRAGVGGAEGSAEWQWQGRLRTLKDHFDKTSEELKVRMEANQVKMEAKIDAIMQLLESPPKNSTR